MADTITHYIVAKRYLKKHENLSTDFVEGFLYGAQGPDPFFFGFKKEFFEFADSIHDKIPKDLFEKDAKTLSKESEMYQGYYYGLLLHYFVDRIIHQYVGWVRRHSIEVYSHTITETAIDMIMCDREFCYYIQDFKFSKIYKKDKKIYNTVLDFYSRKYDSTLLNYKTIKKCFSNFITFTKLFIRPNMLEIKFFLHLEKKKETPWKYLCHFKIWDNYRIELMNDLNKPWEGKFERFNLSVEEMLDKALLDFEKEVELIKDNDNYKFNHLEEFSCNK